MLKEEKSSFLFSLIKPNITASFFLQFTWMLVAIFNLAVHISFPYVKVESHVL